MSDNKITQAQVDAEMKDVVAYTAKMVPLTKKDLSMHLAI